MAAKVEFRRARAHQRYYLADGTQVPGATTISGLIDKSPVLTKWANDLGLNGIDSARYTDPLKGVGTLTHARILQDVAGGELTEDFDEYSKKEIDLSDNSMLSWWEFKKEHSFGKLLRCEGPRVSERYRFGGTPDIPGEIDGINTVLDLKTGSGIYLEHLVQCAGYCLLVEECDGVRPDRILIVNIPRTPDDRYYVKKFLRPDIDLAQRYFLNLREQYDIKGELEKRFRRG